MKALALDPSMGCTGWAVLEEAVNNENGQIIAAGTIAPNLEPSEGGGRRTLDLYRQFYALIHQHDPGMVVIEEPAQFGAWGPAQKAGLPLYGMAVGAAVCAAAECSTDFGDFEIVFYQPHVWSKGLPVNKKGTDPHKNGRVRLAATLYGRSPESFGTKTKAGNVADAVLLARYALRMRRLNKALT